MSSHPGLIIALGGTGKEVAKRLRRRLQLAYGDQSEAYNAIRFLYIDTDVKDNEALSQHKEQAFPLTVSREVLADAQRSKTTHSERLQMDNWFEPTLRQSLTGQSFEGGVRGVRMYGRLALLATNNLTDLRKRLINDILELRKEAENNNKGSLLIFVIASGGGGTGSGIFPDLGYMITDAIRRSNINLGLCETEGIAAIAAIGRTEEQTQFRNSVALVQELDHFSQPTNIFQASYGRDVLPEDIGREAPYQLITLVAPTQLAKPLGTNSNTAMRELEHKIANYIFMRLNLHGGTNAFVSRLQDMRQNFQNMHTDNKGYPNRYTTFGVALRQFPIGLYRSLAASTLVQTVLNHWLKKAVEGNEFLDIQELKSNDALNAAYIRDIQALRELLALRPPQQVKERTRRSSNDDPIYLELCRTDSESLISALQGSVQNGKLEEAFRTPDIAITLSPNVPGYISGVVSQNKEQMMAAHRPESRNQRLRKFLLDLCLDPERGPRYALRLIQEIGQELQEEMQFIEEALVQGVGGATTNASVAITTTPAPRQQSDPLLLFWKESVEKRTRPSTVSTVSVVPDMAERANRMFEHCLLRARREIYLAIQRTLSGLEDSLDTQIRSLLRHLTVWKRTFVETSQRNQELVETLQYDTLYDKDWFALQVKMIQAHFDLKQLIALKQKLLDGSLPHNVPRNDKGEADFSLFDPITEFFEDSFNVMEINGARIQDNLSILRLIAKPDADENIDVNGLDKLSRNLVQEGLPLLNLRLDAVGYGEIIADQYLNYETVWQSIAYCGKDRPIYDAFQQSMGNASRATESQLRAGRPIDAAEHDDPSIVSNIFVRGAFPSHIIVGYSHEEREEMLKPRDVRGIVTAFSQKNIQLMVHPKVVDEARRLLIVGEAISARAELREGGTFKEGVPIRSEGIEEHIFTYRIAGQQKSEFHYNKWFFERAVMALSYNTEARQQLALEVSSRAKNTKIQGNITDLVKTCMQELREKMKESGGSRYFRPLDLGDLDFEKALFILEEWLTKESKIPLTDSELTDIHPWATFHENKREWVCRKCNVPLGAKPPDFETECPNQSDPVHAMTN